MKTHTEDKTTIIGNILEMLDKLPIVSIDAVGYTQLVRMTEIEKLKTKLKKLI